MSQPCPHTVVTGSSVGRAEVRFTLEASATHVAPGSSLVLHADQRILGVDILLADDLVFAGDGRLRFVDAAVSTDDAASGACVHNDTSLGYEAVSAPFADAGGAQAKVSGEDACGQIASVDLQHGALFFKMGGIFSICFSDTGEFFADHVGVLNVTIDVTGVFHSCAAADCLSQQPYMCYASPWARSAYGSCTLTYDGPGQGFHGSVGKATWSPAWDPIWSSGLLLELAAKSCGLAPETTLFCPNEAEPRACEDDANSSAYYIDPDPAVDHKGVTLPPTRPMPTVTHAMTLAACYCPGLNACDDSSDFVQQIGVIFIFVVKLCDASTGLDCSTSNGYGGVAPSTPFTILVLCAPSACHANDGARIKLVDAHVDNDKPAWHEHHGCHVAAETPLRRSPPNCESPTNCSVQGGRREDQKLFGDGDPFVLVADSSRAYESRNFHASRPLDLCFCRDDCYTAGNWFKVGSMVQSSYRLLDLYAGQGLSVNVPLTIGFHRPAIDEHSIGLGPSSMLKLVPDPDAMVGDVQCSVAGFDTTLSAQFSYNAASSKYLAHSTVDGDALVFNSGDASNVFSFSTAGVVAICYCREHPCQQDSAAWVFAMRLEVRGPMLGHEWSFPTGLSIRLAYAGYGLSSNNTLRLVPSTASCTSGSIGPSQNINVFVGCPHACASDGNTDLATQIVSHATVGCDVMGRACDRVYLRSVRVLGDDTTDLEFTGDPGLTTGDRIVLTAGLHCGVNCTSEQLASVTGRYQSASSAAYAGNRYYVANPVTSTSSAHHFLIPVGWSGVPFPQFLVREPELGEWSCTSRAVTAEEIRASAAVSGLRVCWALVGGAAYTAEVGTLAFFDPPSIVAPLVSFLTTQADAAAPIVVSFATGLDRAEYSAEASPTFLRLGFRDVDLLEPLFVDHTHIVPDSSGQDDGTALVSQSTCGRLFRELWCVDQEVGFPLPRGCRFRILGNVVELSVHFGAGNGLQAGKEYQLVLLAKPKLGLLLGQQAVDVHSMVDDASNPYQVIEAGQAEAVQTVQEKASGDLPQFSESSGAVILGGTNSMLLLGGTLDLSCRLSGKSPGKIVGGAVLRFFLWPLTQWDMSYTTVSTASCTASCTQGDGTSCGEAPACAAESVISPLAQKNTVRLTLPSRMPAMHGDIRHVVRIRGLTLPSGGFFPDRMGVEVRASSGALPDYTISSGDYLWKAPDIRAQVGELVTAAGDGNARPFRGDLGNELYVHARLGSTLRALDEDSVATLTVRLPRGYMCVSATSDVPRSLSIFGGTATSSPAYGSSPGLLDVGTWSCANEACTYRLRVHGAVFAASHFFLKLVVNNPASALPYRAADAAWAISSTGPGCSGSPQHTGEYAFLQGSSTPGFDTGASVLGKLLEYSLQPTNFRVSAEQYLYIFFKVEQSVGTEGDGCFVWVDAPSSFDFGTSCSSRDLPAKYYTSTGKDKSWPLPTIAACVGAYTDAQYVDAPNRAQIQINGSLQQGRRYGFMLLVVNPSTYFPEQHAGWYLWTLSAALHRVDGSPTSLPFNPVIATVSSSPSWAVYQHDILEAGASPCEISISPLLPHSWMLQEATITVSQLRVRFDVTSTLRITAPVGFNWSFGGQGFIYAAKLVPASSADLPGRLPSRSGNVLWWPTATYLAAHTYGFSCKIRVPDASPTAASSAFFIEFGYVDRGLDGSLRSMAGRVDAPAVRALSDARVEYSSNVRGQKSIFKIMVRTVTFVPCSGGLAISVPSGFVFSEACAPQAIDTSSGVSCVPVPGDAHCAFVGSQVAGSSEIRIVAGDAGLPPGLYGFKLVGVNPPEATLIGPSIRTKCKATHCWTFQSLRALGDRDSALDYEVSIPSFNITDQMLDAHLAARDDASLGAEGRDDRPSRPNVVTVIFTLKHRLLDPATLVLRAPQGFTVGGDCLASESVLSQRVSTAGITTFPLSSQGGGAWEPFVPIKACAGEGPVAYFEFGGALEHMKVFAISVYIQANPSIPPTRNDWVLESPREASTPFPGFCLHTFSDASITAATSAALSDVNPILNVIDISFRPFTDLGRMPTAASGAALLLAAPDGFQIAMTTPCPLLLQQLDLRQVPDLPPKQFGKDELQCELVHAGSLAIRFVTDHVLHASHQCLLRIGAYNPPAPTTQELVHPGWVLSSYHDNEMMVPADEGELLGFAINRAVGMWSYESQGELMGAGGKRVNGLQLNLQFAENVATRDTLIIKAPEGFDLVSPGSVEGLCSGVMFGPVLHSPISSLSQASCANRTLQLLVLEEELIPAGTLIQVFLDVLNPPLPPTDDQRHWHVSHVDLNQTLLSSGAFDTWRILPELQAVLTSLAGPSAAAGSTGTIEVFFTTVSTADCIRVDARHPEGFDFSASGVGLAGQHVIAAQGAMVKVGTAMAAGQAVHIMIVDVKLPAVGGGTRFEITTYLADNIADRTADFLGFRLPWGIRVTHPTLQSAYNLDPSSFPVKSLWRAHAGSSIVLSLPFVLSNAAGSGQTLRVSSPLYEFTPRGLQLVDSVTNLSLPIMPVSQGGGELRASLPQALAANRAYTLMVQATVANSPARFVALETCDGGTTPTGHANITISATDPEFQLAARFTVAVWVTRSPPRAEIDVTFSTDFGSARPSALRVIAPLNYVFHDDCLVDGVGFVHDCRPGSRVAERPSADLGCFPSREFKQVSGLKLRVTLPIESPPSSAWFVEGINVSDQAQVGWGEDPHGFPVVPMPKASVVYAGIASSQTQAAFGFRSEAFLEAGGRVSVWMPEGFQASCMIGDVMPISLPGVVGCDTQGPAVVLTLDSALPAGDYAFVLTAWAPSSTPHDNVFALVLLDSFGAVQHSAPQLAGQSLHQDFSIHPLPLSWTSSVSAQASTVTLGFSVTAALAAGVVGSLAISFPPYFSHAVDQDAGVTLQVPKHQSVLLHPYAVDSLVVEFNSKQGMSEGDYLFSFPVTVPTAMPPYNVWLLMLCPPSTTGPCLSGEDAAALVTFPWAGFDLGQPSPMGEDVAQMDTPPPRSRAHAGLTINVLVLLGRLGVMVV